MVVPEEDVPEEVPVERVNNMTFRMPGAAEGMLENITEVPEAKGAMDKFKMEVANELGVNLKKGYNGDLTTKQTGSVGGEMVRRMIKRQEEQMANNNSSSNMSE